jgi:hypothetical protein
MMLQRFPERMQRGADAADETRRYGEVTVGAASASRCLAGTASHCEGECRSSSDDADVEAARKLYHHRTDFASVATRELAGSQDALRRSSRDQPVLIAARIEAIVFR